jgi:hypothetical protein
MLRPSHKDDFLERTKAAREERQLEKIRGKMLRMGTEVTPCCAPLTRMISWREPRQPGRRDSWRKYEVRCERWEQSGRHGVASGKK